MIYKEAQREVPSQVLIFKTFLLSNLEWAQGAGAKESLENASLLDHSGGGCGKTLSLQRRGLGGGFKDIFWKGKWALRVPHNAVHELGHFGNWKQCPPFVLGRHIPKPSIDASKLQTAPNSISQCISILTKHFPGTGAVILALQGMTTKLALISFSLTFFFPFSSQFYGCKICSYHGVQQTSNSFGFNIELRTSKLSI